MPNKKDYLSDSNFDLLVQSGDFKQGEATDVHSKVIMYAVKGEVRQFALLGVALNSYIGSSVDIDIIDNAITAELNKDNITVVDIDTEVSNSTITSNVKVK